MDTPLFHLFPFLSRNFLMLLSASFVFRMRLISISSRPIILFPDKRRSRSSCFASGESLASSIRLSKSSRLRGKKYFTKYLKNALPIYAVHAIQKPILRNSLSTIQKYKYTIRRTGKIHNTIAKNIYGDQESVWPFMFIQDE